MAQAPDLNDAVARLKQFRMLWEEDDLIDEESELRTTDLDVILSFLDDSPSSD
jgi:hypothetical protein